MKRHRLFEYAPKPRRATAILPRYSPANMRRIGPTLAYPRPSRWSSASTRSAAWQRAARHCR